MISETILQIKMSAFGFVFRSWISIKLTIPMELCSLSGARSERRQTNTKMLWPQIFAALTLANILAGDCKLWSRWKIIKHRHAMKHIELCSLLGACSDSHQTTAKMLWPEI